MKILVLVFAFLALFFSVFLVSQKIRFLPKAAEIKANIVVDPTINQGQISPIWQALAQGGEELSPFDNILEEISQLRPQYIRIDHLYDFYEVVKKEGNQLIFDWSKLDRIVGQILSVGARPYFSLSYMPPVIAQNNDITGMPIIWEDWSVVVQKTIEHYSGRNNLNLSDVIYEVWNEPDLFGDWRIGGSKNYLLLYKYAVIGANRTENVNSFKIGGPATTASYKNWVDKFLKYIIENNLRLDFYSWHKYSLDPLSFLADVDKIDTWLFQNAGYTLPKYLTEWGSVSDKSPDHDAPIDAAHLVAIIRQLLQRVDLAFTFEIKDGPSTNREKYYGGWGILTHETAGPVEKKPRYFALELLNQLAGNRVKLEGEGTWVTGLAVQQNQTIRVILVNFDPKASHFETTPVQIINLENGRYLYRETTLLGTTKTDTEIITSQKFSKNYFLNPNSVILIELSKI